MTEEIGWELYRSFLGVLREGSLSAAARALGVAQPTVGRHVSALEKALGLTLFTRSQTGLLPTEAAQSLLGYAQAMESSAAALKRAAENKGNGNGADGVAGTVRISASEVVGVELLPPILAELQRVHAQLKIELVLTNRVQDLLRREADIAVRMTQPKQELLIARRVNAVTLGLHAHERYLAPRASPRTPADLADHVLIGFDKETPFLRAASAASPGWRRSAFALRTDSDLAQLALIRAGCGIGICQVGLAKREPALVRVLPRHYELKLETWITMHEDLRNSAACKAVFDALVKGMS